MSVAVEMLDPKQLIGSNYRETDPGRVEELKRSIARQKQLQPIGVVQTPRGAAASPEPTHREHRPRGRPGPRRGTQTIDRASEAAPADRGRQDAEGVPRHLR